METEELFNDLPDGSAEPTEQDEEPLTDAEKDALRNVSIAERAEKRRLKEAQERLEATRTARKEAEKAAKAAENGEEPPEQPKPEVKTEDVASIVKTQLDAEKRKEYLAKIAENIKALAKNKAEAVEAYKEAERLPPTGDPKMDAEFAFDRIKRLKQAKDGYVPPSVGGSFADMPDVSESTSKFSKGQLQHAQERGLTEDDLKTYSSGPNLKKIFPK
jgi:phage-related protein